MELIECHKFLMLMRKIFQILRPKCSKTKLFEQYLSKLAEFVRNSGVSMIKRWLFTELKFHYAIDILKIREIKILKKLNQILVINLRPFNWQYWDIGTTMWQVNVFTHYYGANCAKKFGLFYKKNLCDLNHKTRLPGGLWWKSRIKVESEFSIKQGTSRIL